MDLLGRFTARMLVNGLRENGGHPRPEFGDGQTWRYYYLEECKRRGLKLLKELDGPTHDDAPYVNIHTGSVESLIDIASDYKGPADRQTIADQTWSVVEHWEPCEVTGKDGKITEVIEP